MREMIKMVVVLTVLSAVSGGLLAYLRTATAAQIESQELEFVKGPAIRQILAGATNDPVNDRFKLEVDGKSQSFFVGVYDGVPSTVVFEVFGKGYGDAIGLMVAVNIETDKLAGVAVTTHKETPGLGAQAKEDPAFGAQFVGLPVDQPVKISKDGGSISALSGATITSRGVCEGVSDALGQYRDHKSRIVEQVRGFKS
jgi:Na+-translocating ferredoxin:NAD+ oxidoreductase subunit G